MIRSSPIKAITTGLGDDRINGIIAPTTSAAVDIGGGGRITITPSTPSSASRVARQPANSAGPALARASTGLRTLAAGGNCSRSTARGTSLRAAKLSPFPSGASAARGAGAPPPEGGARLLPQHRTGVSDEGLPVAHALEVNGDDPCVRICGRGSKKIR